MVIVNSRPLNEVESSSKEHGSQFLEVQTVEEANRIDPTVYRFVDFSRQRDKYIFVRRVPKVEKPKK